MTRILNKKIFFIHDFLYLKMSAKSSSRTTAPTTSSRQSTRTPKHQTDYTDQEEEYK